MPPFEKCYYPTLFSIKISLMLLFVVVCFILLYWPVIVSFFSSVKIGISIQLVAITNLNVTPATLFDFSATAQNEIGFPIHVGRFVGDLDCIMKGRYWPSST